MAANSYDHDTTPDFWLSQADSCPEAVLKKASEAFGLGDIGDRTLKQCLEFETGRALIIGPGLLTGLPFS
jgi:hypothetical protein